MHKQGSKERGQTWKLIVENLNSNSSPSFRVIVRSVRHKFAKLIQKFKSNENKEARASGIQGQEYDEVYGGLTDICQRMKEAKSMWEKETEKENRRKIKKEARQKI